MGLIEKIRRARETGVDVDGRKYVVRRPTDEEALGLSGVQLVEVVKRFTVGWSLAEIDLIPGGGPDPVPFDPALFAEWVADRPEVWGPLSAAILDAYKAHSDKRDGAVKN